MVRLLAERVTELEAALAASRLPPEERLAGLLTDLARRFGRSRGRARSIEIPLTQGELASLVGCARETVNRTLRRLAGSGVVVLHEGRPVLLRPARRLRPTATERTRPTGP
jgi:CRP-like cAMP-binding protein